MEPITLALGLAKLTGLDKTIGGWLGGKNGEEVAGKVIDAAQIITGQRDPKKVLDVMTNDHQSIERFNKALIDRQIEFEKLANADRADARAMQVAALGSGDKFSQRFIYMFSAAWSLFGMAYLACITFMDVPPDNVRFADTTLGFLLATVLGGMIGFFYGSSDRETRKETQKGTSSEL